MTPVSRTANTAATTATKDLSPSKGAARSGSMNYWASSPLPATSAAALAPPAAIELMPAPTFQPSGGSELLARYGNLDKLADDSDIGGRDDRERFHSAMTSLQTCAAKPQIVAPEGQQSTRPTLKLTPEQIAAIQAAPTPEAAKLEVLKAISQQTGIAIDKLDPTHAGQNGNRAAREALNAILGTSIKDGREKNAGSAIMLDAICDSVAKGVRSLPPPAPVQQAAAAPSSATHGFGSEFPSAPPVVTPPPPTVVRPPEDITVDLGDYLDPAKDIRELNSPLIFDLQGTGLKLKSGELIDIDIDGDGKSEIITDLDKGMGLLVFSSKCQVRGASAAGRDYFGDKTDLSAYGIVSRSLDKSWANGFDALRALAEHFELVRKDKQYLDAADLSLLEREVGLRMRLDGVKGSDRLFADVGITRINLGDAKKIVSLRDAKSDAFGNKIMTQAGATFVVRGKTREYADLWFNVQARAKASAGTPAMAPMKASAMGGFARRM